MFPQTQERSGVPAGTASGSSSISGRGPTSSSRVGSTDPVYRNSITIRGRVELKEGGKPPSDTQVLLRCVGQPDLEEEVDSSGHFAFQFTGVNPESVTGPRTYGVTFGVHVDCRIQAVARGYYSQMEVVAGQDSFGNFDAGVLKLHAKSESGGLSVSATTLEAPAEAREAYERGRKLAAKKKWKKARSEFEAAVSAFPKFAAAWFELGRVADSEGKAGEARLAFEKAIQADERYLPPQMRMAVIEAGEGNWQRVLDRTGRIIAANPYEFSEAYFYRAAAAFRLNDWEMAESSGRAAIDMNVHQTYPQVVHILGMVLAQQGKFDEAVAELERFLEIAPEARERPIVEQQIAAIRDRQ